MMFKRFRDLLSSFLRDAVGGQLVEHMAEIQETQENLVDEIQKLGRQTRRLSLSVDSQGEKLSELESSLAEAIETSSDRNEEGSDVSIDNVGSDSLVSEHDWLILLDGLSKLRSLVALEPGVYSSIVEELHSKMLDLSGLRPIAEVGESYHPTLCSVVSSQETTDAPEGSILSVVRQGYVREDESCVREALVVVGKAPASTNDIRDIKVEASENNSGNNCMEADEFTHGEKTNEEKNNDRNIT